MILVVDDEPLMREILALEFRKRKISYLTAASVQEAMDLVNLHPILLIVSDIRMPNGDGPLILDALDQRLLKQPKVIFMTGYSDYSEADLVKRGALGLIQKPTRIQYLVDEILLHYQTQGLPAFVNEDSVSN